MLYLEDYLEMIEHLPQELRDRFTEMREIDLSVQNNIDSLEKRVRMLFAQCRRNEIQTAAADAECGSIKKDYYRVLEEADEKVTIANQTYELVERYLQKLDDELHKFKCELEADHNGITEVLEKRALELETNSMQSSQKENRYFGAISSGTPGTPSEPRHHKATDGRYRHNKPEKRRDSASLTYGLPEKRPVLTASLSAPIRTPTGTAAGAAAASMSPHPLLATTTTTPNTPTLPYNLQHLGANNAIAAAASQAIVATQQMPQGRRTASLKASIEAIAASNLGAPEIVIGRELAGATQNVIQAVERDTNNMTNQKRHKKKMGTAVMGGPAGIGLPGSSMNPMGNNSDGDISSSGPMLNENGMVVEQTPEGEWSYDPNEPRYCVCNQVSYGDMVACDNEDCPFEWFHYPCVGITSSPKGKWYCPQCSANMRRRGGNVSRKA
ncbi:inhibitor of growth protein 3 [Culicoides brevitarsis]|uniref:inhibitor of growth protein 3 n=1 Tax=Culicoides brevitarsis TaxID=469753 RepID=UPI00307B1E15